jgi:hypothetical protein
MFSIRVERTGRQIMVEATPSILCRCKVVQNKIVFCTLHKQAETLLAVCDYLQKFIGDVKLGETKDEIFVREIVLPYLNSAIDAATTKEKRT